MADWYAFEEIEPAVERTKDLLLPFDLGTWARLLVLVIFTASGFNLPTGPGGTNTGGETNFSDASTDINTELPQAVDQQITGFATGTDTSSSFAAVIIILILAFAALLFFVRSVMSLVYYKSLLDDKVRIRSNFKDNLRRGFSYFGFQLTVLLGLVLVIGAVVLSFMASPVIGVLTLLPLLLIIIAGAIFLGLTDNFVLPKMLEDDQRVVEAWRAIYPDLKDQWRQVGIYVIIRAILKLTAGIVNIFWVIATLIVAVIVFGILAIPLYLISESLVIIPIVLGLIAWLLSAVLIQIPIQTYLRYYAILVYEDLTS